jgi:hypothetical protein
MRILLALSMCAVSLPAAAQEADGDLRLMREPHSWVDVADAFDDEDPFDVNVSLAYIHRREWGTIQRENGTWAPGPGEDPNRLHRIWNDVANHEHVQNILEIGLDVGIFRDLMIYGRMPIILSDDRSFNLDIDPNSRLVRADDSVDDNGDLVDDLDPSRVVGSGDPSDWAPLFETDANGDFRAPTRSGLDYIAAGLAWSIFNQNRERDLPTWVLMLEGRFNVGDSLAACRQGAGGTLCREWERNEADDSWSFSDRDTNPAGSSRGTNALRIETRASWRTRYVEPFAGLEFQIEWPGSSERFFLPAGDVQGFINEQPPITGMITGGLAIIPWEDRAAFQRLAFDLRFQGRYISEGHGYSPLFDALGTSNNRYFTQPALEGNPNLDPGADLRSVPFFGLTDTQSHAEFGMHVGAEMWAARYVRFLLSMDLTYIEPFLITYADACNPNVNDDMIDDDDPRRGTCRRGIINPHHRPQVDLPGQRFRVDEQVRIEIRAQVNGTF